MKTNNTKVTNVNTYIATFPKETQKLLQQIRTTIKKAAPQAEELISYQIPAFTLNGRGLVYFAGYKNHIGLYPAPRAIEAFKKALSIYKGSKGTVQFPLDKPLPLELIKKIVAFKVKENLEKTNKKKLSEANNAFLSLLSVPAKRALENKGITTLQKLSRFSETEILSLHGIGLSSLPKLRNALNKEGLAFKNKI